MKITLVLGDDQIHLRLPKDGSLDFLVQSIPSCRRKLSVSSGQVIFWLEDLELLKKIIKDKVPQANIQIV